MPETRILEVGTTELQRDDTLWLTTHLMDLPGIKATGGANVEVRKVNVANKYVWVNQDNEGPAIRLPKDATVTISRDFETEAETAAKMAAYERKSLELFVADIRNSEGNKPILEQMVSGGVRVDWSSLDTLVRSTARQQAVDSFLHAMKVVMEREGDTFDLVTFAAEYSQYLTDQLMQSYGFRSTSKSTNVLSNVMEEATREYQAKMVEALKGSRWSF